jgi:hypothetical protein
MEKQDVEKYFDKIENAEIEVRLNFPFGNLVVLMFTIITVVGTIGAIFGDAFSPDLPSVVLFNISVPMFAFIFGVMFFIEAVCFIAFSIKYFICTIKLSKDADGAHIFYFYRRKIVYRMETGIRLIIKKDKYKLKRPREFFDFEEFWKVAYNAEDFKLREKNFVKTIVYTLGHNRPDADPGPPIVKLKLTDGNVKLMDINAKYFEYKKVNSNSFFVKLPTFAKEAFKRNNIQIPSFVRFKDGL